MLISTTSISKVINRVVIIASQRQLDAARDQFKSPFTSSGPTPSKVMQLWQIVISRNDSSTNFG